VKWVPRKPSDPPWVTSRNPPLDAGPTTPAFNITVRDGERGVDLRKLHRELQSGKDFSTWAKQRLKDFVEGQDFAILLPKTGEQVHGGHNRIDYAVSIECAKHIAMMERTDRGRQIRQYFIDFEKAVRERGVPASSPAFQVPQTLSDALRLAADLADQNAAQARRPDTPKGAVAGIKAQSTSRRRAFERPGDFEMCLVFRQIVTPIFEMCFVLWRVFLESDPRASMNLWNRKWRIKGVSFGTSTPLGGGGRGVPRSGDVDLDARRRTNPLFEVFTHSGENSRVRHRIDYAVSIARAKLTHR